MLGFSSAIAPLKDFLVIFAFQGLFSASEISNLFINQGSTGNTRGNKNYSRVYGPHGDDYKH